MKIGTIIVAIGANELRPEGMFGYHLFKNVMTQLEFEQQYGEDYSGLKDVVMINCVGARTDDMPYCGRFCCITAMKNAILLKEADPEAEVTILQRDIMAFGKVFEEYYQKAMQVGVRFVRYTVDRLPEIDGVGDSGQ